MSRAARVITAATRGRLPDRRVRRAPAVLAAAVGAVMLALASVRAGSAPAEPLVVFLGDSLTAGLGLPARDAFPAVLERELRERGAPIRIVNAGVSGDTTAGGLSRLSWLLAQKPEIVVVELGANDGLRGQPLGPIEENLREIVSSIRAAGASAILVDMTLPGTHGGDYVTAFTKMYGRIADDLDVALVEGFLRGVGGVASMNQPDGIHPTAEGHARLARNVLPVLVRVLREAGESPGMAARDGVP